MHGPRRIRALGALGLALTLTGPAAAATDAPTLVERPTCAAPDGRRPAPTGAPGETLVSFDVPPLAHLRVEDGAVVAAATNTGCAPRSGDTFVVGGRAATPGETAAALAAFDTGDWRRPGVWHHR